MFNKIIAKLAKSGKAKGITWQDDVRPMPSSFSPFCFSRNGTYDNAFASISRIAESFAEVTPFAVDENGKRLMKQPQLIRALNNPNEEMSGTDFMETLMTMMLVHPAVYIMLWHYDGKQTVMGGPVTPDNIAGFTFLEGASVLRFEGKTQYLYKGKTYTNKDVIALSLNVNPYSLGSGYSPSQAIKKWATVDDYIAEYQAATFRNDARPAGEMIITASSVDAYNEAVDRLQAAHRGPNNANNIVYTHRPTSQIDGKPMAAGVEWVPFAQSNKDLTLDSLFNQANKKLDMAFGVPEEVKGYLQNSNYASAEVAQYVFQRYVIYPKLVKIYSKLTHELNRVTGGLGFTLDFDYELPVLTDTRKVQADSLKVLLDAGFSVESAVEALQLPESFKKLDKEKVEEEQNPEVVEENDNTPAPALTEATKSVGNKKKTLSDASSTSVLNASLVNYINYFFTQVLKSLSESSENVAGDALEAIERVSKNVETDKKAVALRKLVVASLFYLLSVRDEAATRGFAKIAGLTQVPSVLTAAELDSLNIALQAQNADIHGSLLAGNTEFATELGDIEVLSDKVAAELEKYNLTEVIPDVEDAKTYPRQLTALLVLFGIERLEALKGPISQATTLTEAQLAAQNAAAESNYYIGRWTDSEAHRAEELGTLLAAEEAGDVAHLEPVKTWHINPASPDVCENCIAMDGQTVRADLPFSNGDMVPHYHPHCYCTMSVSFREYQGSEKSVKVCCPHCKRYMFESAGGSMKNVICANSKCKRHWDFEVRGTDIKSTEVKPETAEERQ